MTAGTKTFRRARNPEQRRQRTEAILFAARELALRKGVRAVRLADIAAEVGLHKSAPLRYFETREQIYLVLTAEEWRDWADTVVAELADRPAAIAEILSQTLAERPLFCDLLAHAPMNLERNVSRTAVCEFKLVVLDALDSLSMAAERALAPIRPGSGRELIAAVTSLAAALWQTAHPAEALVALYAEDPRLTSAAVDFLPRLEQLTVIMIRGLIARPL